MNNRTLRVVESVGAVVERGAVSDHDVTDERPPCIEPGIYLARGTGVYLRRPYRNLSTRLHYFFELEAGPIVGEVAVWSRERPEPYTPPDGYMHPAGVQLPRYYTSRDHLGRIGGGWHSDIVHEWVIAANRRPERSSRLDMSVFRDRLFVVEIELVKTRHGGAERHPAMYYSKVARIIRRHES